MEFNFIAASRISPSFQNELSSEPPTASRNKIIIITIAMIIKHLELKLLFCVVLIQKNFILTTKQCMSRVGNKKKND